MFDDLFGNANVDPEGFAGPQNAYDAASNAGGSLGDMENFFSDPNVIRGMGETGAAMSAPGSIGRAVGAGASNLVKRRQLQKGARGIRSDRETKNQSVNDQLMSFLFENKLLGPLEDNDTNDAITIKSDGSISSSMKNVPAKANFQQQPPLESIGRPAPGGVDLPDFSNQPGEAAFDFAGLDGEDINMLIRAEQRFGELDQRQMKTLLEEKNRRTKAFVNSKRRAVELKQLGEDRFAKIAAKKLEVEDKKDAAIKLAESKTALKKFESELKTEADELTPEEKEVNTLELRKLKKTVENLEAGIGKPATAVSQTFKDKQKADLERAETKLGMKLDELEKEEIYSVQPTFVDEDGNNFDVDFEEREGNAQQANNRSNNKVFYSIQQPVEDVPGVYTWGTDQPGTVTPVFLPKNKKTGKQITSQDIINLAKKLNISPEEILRQKGLL